MYANLLVPGQELAVHTDVPEFRGVNRKKHPQWLIVVMHHSGLFEEWRMPIATGVSWFHDCAGGEFAFYPEGADAKPVAHPVRYNTALPDGHRQRSSTASTASPRPRRPSTSSAPACASATPATAAGS